MKNKAEIFSLTGINDWHIRVNDCDKARMRCSLVGYANAIAKEGRRKPRELFWSRKEKGGGKGKRF